MRRNASPADRERIRRTLSMVLEVLSGLGVPGAGIARTVVEETARALEHGETQRKLAEALRQAEEDFREEAQRRGWHEAADLILQLPIHDLPSFRKALQAALQEGESEELAQALEQALSPSPLSPPERAEAALLYARCVWARLWGEPAFRAPVRDILFRDHVALLEDVSARLDRLVEALPGRVVDEQERRARQRAWRALRPAVLPPPERLTPENLLESLKAPYRLVAFTGAAPEALRDEVVRALAGLAPAETRAWVLWGPGGIGKTRVAVEVARALEGKGWQAFFVPRAAEVPAWPEALHHWSRPERPTLLIVDYAEQRTGEELEALAQAVRAAAAERRSPLALLFLMRADPEEPVAGHVTGALKGADLRYDARPVPPLRAPEEREALFRQARQLFRERLAPPEAPPGVEYPPEALPETPLALLALAVLAAFGHRVAQSRDEVAVLTDLWERWEQPRWRRTLEAQGGADLLRTPEVWAEARERIEQALAAATLGRPFSSPEAVAAWWQAHYPFRARTARGETLDPLWLAHRLQSLFPAPERAAGWSLPPITPDPLADLVLARRGAALGELVSSVLPGPEEIPQEVVELRALVWPIRMVVEVLPRLSDAAVPGASEAAQAALEAVARWLKETIQALPLEVATDWLKAWDAELPPPDRTLALRPFLVDFYRAWLERIPREEVVEQARLLNKLGAALSALGRREEALAATQEAVGIYRQLAATTPQAFLSDLAASLHNLGIWLSELGRREEALAAAQEAVAICRQLAQTHPHAFLPDLARSLNNLGDRLFELGRREEALAAYEEAVRVLAPFFLKLPAAFADRMSSMVWDYIDACRALGREPDEELLGPIRALLGGD